MTRCFNITGCCNPEKHYMVDLNSRLARIKKMVDNELYFAINKGRQYGKTTILNALANKLKEDYLVLSLDFQFLDSDDFENARTFVISLAQELLDLKLDVSDFPEEIREKLESIITGNEVHTRLNYLFKVFSRWCEISRKPIVLIIDEVDSASNNQVFLDFLAQLRGYYLTREKRPTFQSVILAGVHDIRNLRQKIRSDTEHKHNSPWNIASSFDVDMSFSTDDILSMLKEYENDHHTGMDILKTAQQIYDYTSGYPVLVSSICKYMDENGSWNHAAFENAVKRLVKEKNPLVDSLINKIEDDEGLRDLLYKILFLGQKISFNIDNAVIENAAMYGFVTSRDDCVSVANRIFETRLYNWFISQEATNSKMYAEGMNDKSQFIIGKTLNMEKILEKFIQHFNDVYGNQPDEFKEAEGRKLFMLYLRPIINGTGNYYIEAQTRNQKRTDMIIDYFGQQYVIELKIWHGDEYNTKGEKQIADYLEEYHLDKGYLLSFNFNKNKKTGLKTTVINGKTVVEAVV